jgi:hypothetical protein
MNQTILGTYLMPYLKVDNWRKCLVGNKNNYVQWDIINYEIERGKIFIKKGYEWRMINKNAKAIVHLRNCKHPKHTENFDYYTSKINECNFDYNFELYDKIFKRVKLYHIERHLDIFFNIRYVSKFINQKDYNSIIFKFDYYDDYDLIFRKIIWMHLNLIEKFKVEDGYGNANKYWRKICNKEKKILNGRVQNFFHHSETNSTYYKYLLSYEHQYYDDQLLQIKKKIDLRKKIKKLI